MDLQSVEIQQRFNFKCCHKTEGDSYGCGMQAEFLVWYEGCGGLYTYMCSRHTAEDIQGFRNYRVVAVKHIKEAILDRQTSVAP